MKDFEKFYTEYLSYKALYGKNGVSFRYYAAGYPLGQRACALRNGNAKVTEEQRKMLDEAGFPWQTTKRHKQCPFNIFYAELLKYQKEFGTIDVPRYYETEDGIRLGMVLKSFKYGSRKLTPYQKKKLLAIGFAFDKKFYRSYSFEKVLKAFQKYYNAHETNEIPTSFVDEDHIPIGRIACDIRRGKRKVSPKQWRELDSICFCWHISKEEYSFEEKMLFLEAYKNEFGDVNVPQKYVTKEGVPLGEIVHLLRQRKTLTQGEVDALNCLGFVWKNHHRSSYSFEEYVNMLEEYYHEHGSYMIKASYKTKEGLPLGQIHYSTLNGHRKITDEQIEVLRKMGLDI